MVTVGDVANRNLFEALADGGNLGIVIDNPDGVAESVAVAHEVIDRLALGDGTEQVELAVVAVGQEHRTRIGVGVEHVTQTVLFLVGAGQFVLLDDAVEVVGGRHGAHEAVLFAAVHRLAVDVQAVLLVVRDDALGNHLLEVRTGMGVDLRVVGVDAVVEFQLGTGHAQVGMRQAFRHGLGFGAVHHVVRECGNVLGLGGVHRAKGLERVDVHHGLLSFVRFLD